MRDELDALLEQVRALDEREGSVAALSALKRTPFEDQALYFAALGTLAARAGSAHEAIEAFAQACRLEPGSAVAHANHGMALLDQAAGTLDDEPDQQALDEALAALQRAVALDGELGYAHAGLGLGYHLLEHLDQAKRCLDRAVEVEPELIMGWYHRGDLMRALGDLSEARRCYSQALALDDQCEPARLRLAELSD